MGKLTIEVVCNHSKLGQIGNWVIWSLATLTCYRQRNLKYFKCSAFDILSACEGQRYTVCFSATCGGRFSGQNGTIVSPNYPSNYDANSNCTWLVSGPTGHYLTITFTAFSLESSTNCANDYVEVREYNATGMPAVKDKELLKKLFG